MIITKQQLEQIIREELNIVLQEEDMELLEEGWKDWLMAAAIGISTLINPVTGQAATPDRPAATQQAAEEVMSRQQVEDLFNAVDNEDRVKYANAVIGLFQSASPSRSLKSMNVLNHFKQWREDKLTNPTVEDAIYLKHVLDIEKRSPADFAEYVRIGSNTHIDTTGR
jgi:hypothetical protein